MPRQKPTASIPATRSGAAGGEERRRATPLQLHTARTVVPALDGADRLGIALQQLAELTSSTVTSSLDLRPLSGVRRSSKIIVSPVLALDAITRNQATFTTRDLAMSVHWHRGERTSSTA